MLYHPVSFRQLENFSSDSWMAFLPRLFLLVCGLLWTDVLQTLLTTWVPGLTYAGGTKAQGVNGPVDWVTPLKGDQLRNLIFH